MCKDMIRHRFDSFRMGFNFFSYVEKTDFAKELYVESRLDVNKVCLFKVYKRDLWSRMEMVGDTLLFTGDHLVDIFNFSLDGNFTHYFIDGCRPYGFDDFH